MRLINQAAGYILSGSYDHRRCNDIVNVGMVLEIYGSLLMITIQDYSGARNVRTSSIEA